MPRRRQPLLQKPSSGPSSFLALLLLPIQPVYLQPSACQEAVDSRGSVYVLGAQQPGDELLCRPDSSVFTSGGVRYCFGKEEAGGRGVYTKLRCSGGGLPPHTSLPPDGLPSEMGAPRAECRKPVCQQFSQNLTDSLDTSGPAPCDDFYEFACGRDTGRSALGEGAERFKARMYQLIKDPPNSNQEQWEQDLRYEQDQQVGFICCFRSNYLIFSRSSKARGCFTDIVVTD